MEVIARIDGIQCGLAKTKKAGSDGSTAGFVLDVAADASIPGCGASGRAVRFTVAGVEVPNQVAWDNTRATNMQLAPVGAAGATSAAPTGAGAVNLYLPSLLRVHPES